MGLLRFLLLCIAAYFVWRFLKSATQTRAWQKSAHRPSEPHNKSPHEILGVPPNATDSEIRAAYQRLVMQYHPDRVADLGPEIIEVAERRIKEINEAYAQLKR